MKRMGRSETIRSPYLAVLVLGAIAMASSAQQPIEAEPIIEYSGEESSVVLSLIRRPAELETADYPTLTVYGDGRVVAHYPHWMKRAGDHSGFLTSEQMDSLVRSVVDRGILDFDPQKVVDEKRETSIALGSFFYVADADTTELIIRLERYRPAGMAGVGQRDVVQRIVYSGLQSEAEHFTSIESLVDLAAVEQNLVALMRDEQRFRPLNDR